MRIVVLAGGLSSERDVSFSSGKKVYNALVENGNNVVLLDVFMGYEENIVDIDALFEENYSCIDSSIVSTKVPNIKAIKEMRKDKSNSFLGQNVAAFCQNADITFLALHGGEGENGQIQATLDTLGIKYTGSPFLGSAIGMNKGITKSILLYNKIGTPYGEIFKPEDKDNGNLNKWDKFPCVVKPCSGGSSVGISWVQDKADFLKAMDDAFAWETEVLVEQFVKGREFSVGVLGGKALPVIEIIPKDGFYDYENKYQEGRTLEICPAQLDSKTTELLQSQAEKAFEALQLKAYARLDFLLDDKGDTYCLEANTLPGMTPTSLLPQEAQAVGISYPELCQQIIKCSLDKYN